MNGIDKEIFISDLIKAGLISFNQVVATSHGDVHPYYMDLRAIYSYPDIVNLAVAWLGEATLDEDYDFVCGIETASLPLVGAFGYATQEPTLYLRTKQKPYGKQKNIEGHYQHGDKIILVDDLTAEPDVSLDFIKIAQDAGAVVVGLYVLYEKMANYISRDIFEEAGYPIKSIFTFEDLANLIREKHQELGLDPLLAELIYEFGNRAD